MFEQLDSLVSFVVRYNLQVIHVPGIICMALVLCLALVIELRTKTIPNRLNYVAVTLGLMLIVWDRAWTVHVVGLLVAFIPAVILWILGYLGGGGVKLVASVACIGGPVVGIFSIASWVAILIGFLLTGQEQEDDAPVHMYSSSVIAFSSTIAVIVLLTQRPLISFAE